MTGRKHKSSYSCKIQMECMSCGKHVLAENQQYHIKTSHDNKNVKFKIVNDAKQLKLTFPKANIVPQQSSSCNNVNIDRGLSDSNSNDCSASTSDNINIGENNNKDSIEPTCDPDDPDDPDPLPSPSDNHGNSDEVLDNNNVSSKSLNDDPEPIPSFSDNSQNSDEVFDNNSTRNVNKKSDQGVVDDTICSEPNQPIMDK